MHRQTKGDSALSRKLSIWMVNYKSADLLTQSIHALAGEPVDEILIWDNSSGADDVAKLHTLANSDSRVRLIESSANIGFGAGINALADRSLDHPDDLIWILNPDTQLFQGSVSALCDQVATGAFDILSPLLVCGDKENPKIWFNGGGIDIRSGRCWHSDYGKTEWGAGDRAQRTEFMTGAAPIMTRKVWDRIGGFHEELFLYWEDVELSLRAADLGLTLGVFGGCVVWHMEGGSGGATSGRSSVYHYYNALNRLRVCSPRSGRLQVGFGRGSRETLASIIRPLIREKDNRVRKSISALKGTVRGMFIYPELEARRLNAPYNADSHNQSAVKGFPAANNRTGLDS